ncbi:hypothetical protein VK72_02455 [Paenibacillus polymyxa]|uniref:toll/interleukin-1 receptor domain-containing protein n=1 Tax=Paenibacillus polymyxa TaxID=1406 RepID=UPI000947661F|nr:toll/interleukin-1 receptor domain-containing protein [Paenibacillus polymyxa]APQ57702.1 hypothetical protein VK72_02455 [Paenibacillus polymyxa]
MEKPKIFISHITEEKELAKIFKDLISKAFLGLPEVFVSSDSESILIGTKWLDEIDQALKDAEVILLLCSQHSVKRPWINFEAGAGWVKRIPVIPICHTDITPSALPIPLNMLQGIEASNKNGLEKVIKLVGQHLGTSLTPEVQYDKIISEIKEFEEEYGILRVVKFHVEKIISIDSRFGELFAQNAINVRATGYLYEITLDKLLEHFKALSDLGFITYGTGGNRMTFGTNGGGNEIQFNIEVNKKYYEIAGKLIE